MCRVRLRACGVQRMTDICVSPHRLCVCVRLRDRLGIRPAVDIRSRRVCKACGEGPVLCASESRTRKRTLGEIFLLCHFLLPAPRRRGLVTVRLLFTVYLRVPTGTAALPRGLRLAHAAPPTSHMAHGGTTETPRDAWPHAHTKRETQTQAHVLRGTLAANSSPGVQEKRSVERCDMTVSASAPLA